MHNHLVYTSISLHLTEGLHVICNLGGKCWYICVFAGMCLDIYVCVKMSVNIYLRGFITPEGQQLHRSLSTIRNKMQRRSLWHLKSHILLTKKKGVIGLDSSADGAQAGPQLLHTASIIDVCASDTSSLWPSGPYPAVSLVVSGGSSLWLSSPHTQPTWLPSWLWRGWCRPSRVRRT